jgi:hypothetical protein
LIESLPGQELAEHVVELAQRGRLDAVERRDAQHDVVPQLGR